jgi:hypothetical protein
MSCNLPLTHVLADLQLALIHFTHNLQRKLNHTFNQYCPVLVGECGVLDMALLIVIRRWFLRDLVSKRENTRRTKLPRNILKKYLSQSQVELIYSQRQTSSKLDYFVAIFRFLLLGLRYLPVNGALSRRSANKSMCLWNLLSVKS